MSYSSMTGLWVTTGSQHRWLDNSWLVSSVAIREDRMAKEVAQKYLNPLHWQMEADKQRIPVNSARAARFQRAHLDRALAQMNMPQLGALSPSHLLYSVMALGELFTAHGLLAAGCYPRGAGGIKAADDLMGWWISGSAWAGDNGGDPWRDRQVGPLVPGWCRPLPPAGPSPIVKAAEGPAIGGAR